MRKEVTKNIPAKAAIPATKKVLTQVFCDVGGESLGYVGGTGIVIACTVCKRDVCRKHTDDDPFEGWSDYPSQVCDICMPIYYPVIKEMNKRHDKEEDDLMEKVVKESLAL